MAQTRSNTSGYALIVVLFGLAILTLIFGIATDRSIAYIADARNEIRLIESAEHQVSMLELAAAWKSLPDNSDGREFEVSIGHDVHQIKLQDVGGLIDLNTASPKLLALLFHHVLEDPNEADQVLAAFRDWRREGRRLQRVSDLVWIAGLPRGGVEELEAISTIWSGRRGLAEAHAPTPVLEIFNDGRQTTSRLLEFQDAPSGNTFQVEVSNSVLGIVRSDEPRLLNGPD